MGRLIGVRSTKIGLSRKRKYSFYPVTFVWNLHLKIYLILIAFPIAFIKHLYREDHN